MISDQSVMHLRAKFGGGKQGATTLEKTPANTLRPELVYRTFPSAKYIHIIRDGRDVILSATKKYRGDTRKITQGNQVNERPVRRLMRDIQYKLSRGLRPSDIVGNFSYYWSSAIRRLGMGSYLWGPKYPGWRYLVKHASSAEVAAYQWKLSVNTMLNFIASKPELNIITVRYEDLLTQPEIELKKLAFFLDYEFSQPVAQSQENGVIPYGWKGSMPDDMLTEVSSLIEHDLQILGYQPSYKHVTNE
jgi:hypothetical protein